MATQKQDRAKLYLDELYNKYDRSRKYVQITIHQYLFFKLIVVQVDGQAKSKLFTSGVERDIRWLAQEPRRDFVLKMLKAGMKQTVIAKCLKFSSATICKDVQWYRENQPWQLDGIKLRARREKKAGPRIVLRQNSAGATLQ
jgi:hypothetical protein